MISLNSFALVPVALFAGAIRGLSGFAGPLIMVPALSFFYDPVSVIATTSLVDLSCNIALFRDAMREASLPTVGKTVAGALLSLPIGAYALLTLDAQVITCFMYSVVAVLAVILLAGWRYKRVLSTPRLFGVGAVNGVILGATSFGVAMLPFFYAGPEPTAQSRANFILWALFCGLAGFAIVLLGGRVGHTELLRAAALAPLYLAGTVLGNLYSKRIDSMLLRRVVLLLLFAVSLAGLAAQVGTAASTRARVNATWAAGLRA